LRSFFAQSDIGAFSGKEKTHALADRSIKPEPAELEIVDLSPEESDEEEDNKQNCAKKTEEFAGVSKATKTELMSPNAQNLPVDDHMVNQEQEIEEQFELEIRQRDEF